MEKIWRKFLAAVLTMFGFNACLPVAMYGTPYADFKAEGSVKNEAGKALQGIRVAVQQHRHYQNSTGVIYDQNDWYENDTTFTDANGKFLIERSVFDGPDDVTIVFEDVDGAENGGEYAPVTATPEVVHSKQGDRGWYGGAFGVSADVKMKKK